MVQTGPNAAAGGVQEGFSSSGYHVRTEFAVISEPDTPTSMHVATETIKAATERVRGVTNPLRTAPGNP